MHDKIIMPYFFRRLAVSFFAEILISFIAVKLVDLNIIAETFSNGIKLVILCIAINIVATWRFLVGYLFGIRDEKIYLRVNLTVYIVMALVVIGASFFNPEPVYTYLFLPYKLLVYVGYSKPLSAALVSLIPIIMVVIMPMAYSADLRHKI